VFTLTVMGDTRAEPSGFDSTVITVPDGAYVQAGSIRSLNVMAAKAVLTQATTNSCVLADEKLHHAEWIFTRDPAQVRTLGLGDGCEDCRAGVASALAYLATHPDREVAVGQLWWAAA